ncbi:hypothetical protein FHT36_004088 [Xanthobacter sp. SG618]|uniref:hypothetical protein n=1 Tax=Xanthobacter sp. SG618 TaxID=2587121 RepID=UPI00145F708D|nr:hypothetical protein [Xanthobacter sp. SG618]NMN60169.1 hypothetical protein [Xanthobacter sp. SG618]
MAAIEPNVAGLAIFAGLWTAACLGFLVLSGMFPASTRPAGARQAGGRALVLVNSLLWLALAAAALAYGYANLRLTSLIVVGGLVLLFAPAPFDLLPTPFRDGRRGLAALVALQASALAVWAVLPGGGAGLI